MDADLRSSSSYAFASSSTSHSRSITDSRATSHATTTSRHKKKRSRQHADKNPADPRVISSIIASLESFQPPITHASYTLVSGSGSEYSLVKNASFSRTSSRRSPSVLESVAEHVISPKMEYGASSVAEHEDSDAADFPVIKTARSSSRVSQYASSPSPTKSSVMREYFRSPSRHSRNPSPQHGQDRDRPQPTRTISAMSAESWIRSQSGNQCYISSSDEEFGNTARSRSTSRSRLRARKRFEDLMAKSITDASLLPLEEDAEPATPPMVPRTSPSARLFLRDGSSEKAQSTSQDARPFSVSSSIMKFDFALTPAPEERTENAPSRKTSPKRNPVADAIPLRTSSLNRTPSPGQKPSKSRKGKSAALKSSRDRILCRTSFTVVSEDPFDGLDEEDQTVKRIKELKLQKENRLREASASSKSASLQRAVDPKQPTSTSTFDQLNAQTPATNLAATRESTTNKGANQKPKSGKAHRLLGSEQTSPGRKSLTARIQERQNQRPPGRLNPALVYQHASHLQRRAPLPLTLSQPTNVRPSLSTTSTESHAQSIASQGESGSGSPSSSKRHLIETTSESSRTLSGLDLEGLESTSSTTTRSLHRRSNSHYEFDPKSVPAIPTDLERRKSMSDVRQPYVPEEDVLEERRNSVADAVNSFLRNPRLNQTVKHPQSGRLISYSEVGDPNGAAVIVCVGMGLTRFISAFYDELATTLRLRLITPERPGVGGSEPYPERDRAGPLNWPDDVLAITNHLRITQFSLMAHSAGAMYAMATALILPHCIKGRIQLLAPWIPQSQFESYGSRDRSPGTAPVGSLPRAQRLLRVLPIPFLKAANGGLFTPAALSKPANGRETSSPGTSPRGGAQKRGKKRPESLQRESMALMDQVVPKQPSEKMFPLATLVEEDPSGLESLRRPSLTLSATATPTDMDFSFASEALNAAEHSARERQAIYSTLLTEQTWLKATRDSNPAVDLLVCLERYRDIGFRYVDIQRPIVITHGAEDKRVPVDNIRWIGEQINRLATSRWTSDVQEEKAEKGGCEVRVLDGEDHGLMASPIVMADVLSEISREWSSTRR